MEGYGESHGAVTIINAFATGFGAALGIDLKTEVYVRKTGEDTIKSYLNGELLMIDHKLVETIIEEFRRIYGLKDNLEINIYTDIPPEIGLKSSSSVANALIIALYDYIGLDYESWDILRLNVDTSLKAGVSKTGALDDAAASLYGGIVFTDNYNRKILYRGANINGEVLIFYRESRNPTRRYIDMEFKMLRKPVERAIDLFKRGFWMDAAILNGLVYASAFGYDLDPLLTSLKLNPLTAGLSGKGPAMYMIDGGMEEMIRYIDGLMGYRYILTSTR